MKKLILCLLVTSSAWAQQQPGKKYNLNDFNLIAKVEDQEKYYNELIKQNPPDAKRPEMYNEYRAQLAVGWLTKGDTARYQYYMRTKPNFSVLQLVDLTYTLEYMVDEDKHIPIVEKASRDLLDKIEGHFK
ncbi:hypothetical protein MKQ70_15585 [Chitinophaga sedimenti]|uniref:hypothetical protein n=1 Tax=Chitinophaga sedimenti TaxID=2033606 RepID=UPI0020051433|nr:hypothetical protein [Chitinophaga sedimenti]MCK7556358.1 hypothetical protein [Chitinophaga sedimenti]